MQRLILCIPQVEENRGSSIWLSEKHQVMNYCSWNCGILLLYIINCCRIITALTHHEMLRAGGACVCYLVLHLGIDSGIRHASLPLWFDENLCLKPMVGSPLTLALAAHCWCYSPKWLDFCGWCKPGLAETCRCRNLFKLVQPPNCLSWFVFWKSLKASTQCASSKDALSSLCPVFQATPVDADHLWHPLTILSHCCQGACIKKLGSAENGRLCVATWAPQQLGSSDPTGTATLGKSTCYSFGATWWPCNLSA